MNLQITGHHLEITPAIREYVTSKMSKVLGRFDNVISAQVKLSVEPLKHKAEVSIHVPGKDLHCESIQEDLYSAIDALIDKADRMVIKHKDKQRDHTEKKDKRANLA